MNGGGFMLGVLAGAMARERAQLRVDEKERAHRGAMQPHREAAVAEEDRRLEEAANAQPVSPIQPPLPVASMVTGADGRFAFGVPSGFGPLPPARLEHWIASTGPSLATVTDLNADGVPMVISANDRGSIDPDLERGFWRLTCDLREEVARSAAQQASLHLTRGPQAILVDRARAIYFAGTCQLRLRDVDPALEGTTEIPNRLAFIARKGGLVEITMQTQSPSEERYLPVWWTVLGSWRWSDQESVTPPEHLAHRGRVETNWRPNVGEGWDVGPP